MYWDHPTCLKALPLLTLQGRAMRCPRAAAMPTHLSVPLRGQPRVQTQATLFNVLPQVPMRRQQVVATLLN